MTAAPGWQDRAGQGQVSPGESPFSAGAIAPVLGKHPLTLAFMGLKSSGDIFTLIHWVTVWRKTAFTASILHLGWYYRLSASRDSWPRHSGHRHQPSPGWLVGLAQSREAAAHSCPFPRERETQGTALVSYCTRVQTP